MQLFSTREPLELLSMDIVGQFQKSVQGNQYTLVFTNCYFKLTLSIQTSSTTATHIANLPMEHWLVLYGISGYPLTNSTTLFVRIFLAAICMRAVRSQASFSHALPPLDNCPIPPLQEVHPYSHLTLRCKTTKELRNPPRNNNLRIQLTEPSFDKWIIFNLGFCCHAPEPTLLENGKALPTDRII